MAPGSSHGAPRDEQQAEDSHVLSPTDGYFNAIAPQPEDEYIPDPQQENTAAAKEIEAREAQAEREQPLSRRATGHSQPSRARRGSSVASSVISASSGRSINTLNGGEGPSRGPQLPSYDDAIAERPYTGPPLAPTVPPGAYGTMADPGGQPTSRGYHGSDHPDIESESQLLLSTTADDDGDGTRGWRGVWQRRVRAWSKRRSPRPLAKKLLVILVIVCITTLMIKVIAILKQQSGSDGQPIAADPIDDEPVGDDPENPSNPFEPHYPDDPTAGWAPRRAREFCRTPKGLQMRTGVQWHFDAPHRIDFVQISDPADGQRRRAIRHRGDVRIVRRLDNETGVAVHLGAYYSHRHLNHLTTFSADDTSIVLRVPRSAPAEVVTDDDLCIYSYATIEVEASYNLSRLVVEAEAMSFSFADDLDLGSSTKGISLLSYTGNINFPSGAAGISSRIRGREIRAETQTGSIAGTFPLYDTLEVISRVGLINITVDPRQANPDFVKPAVLIVDNNAGGIIIDDARLHCRTEGAGCLQSGPTTDTTSKWPPTRDFHTTISSWAGLIDVRMLHGSETRVTSDAGRINAFLFPCDEPGKNTTVDVETRSGLVRLNVANSIRSPKAVLDSLLVNIKSVVSKVTLGLPSTWTGSLEGTSLTGSFRVTLTGFVKAKDEAVPHIPLFQSIMGYRGEGKSLARTNTVSGLVEWTDTKEE